VGAVVEEGVEVWGEGADGSVGGGEEGNGVDDGEESAAGGGGDEIGDALACGGVFWGFEERGAAAEANGLAGG
jgi:hypothetical protein